MTVDRTVLKEAVNFLIASRDYVALVKEIETIRDNWEDRRVYFGGDKECLNAMVQLCITDEDGYSRVRHLIDEKRKLVPEAKRNDYQREFMRQLRARVAKAIKIECIVEGRKHFSPDEKKVREQKLRKSWANRKEQFFAEHGDLSWKERNDLAKVFWESIDIELEQMLQEAIELEGHRPVKKRRVVKVDRVPKTEFGNKLKNAIRGRT